MITKQVSHGGVTVGVLAAEGERDAFYMARMDVEEQDFVMDTQMYREHHLDEETVTRKMTIQGTGDVICKNHLREISIGSPYDIRVNDFMVVSGDDKWNADINIDVKA